MAGKNKIGVEEGDTPHEQEPDTKKMKGDVVQEPVNNGSGDCEAPTGAVVETGAKAKPEEEVKEEVAEEVAEEVKEEVAEDVKEDDDAGLLLICGGTNWDLIGRKELPKSAAKQTPATAGKNLWGPHVWGEKIRIKEVISSCCAVHSVIITTDGKAMTWGRNDKGQLGHGDLVTRPAPTVVKGLEHLKIVTAACGKGHTLFLTDKGDVYACGENKMGQLGIGNQTATVMNPSKVSYSGKPIVRVAAGGEFSMIVDAFGGLYTFGSPEHGQLGHNSEGKYFTTGNKFSYHCETTPRRVVLFIEKTREGQSIPVDDVSILEVAAGVNHAVAIDSKRRCFSWGFAGYGRLGHSDTKNELMPRNIKSFDYVKRGAKKIWAGSTFCVALDESGVLYFWGQNKPSGEATMYPKAIQDLCGWNIRQVACANKSIVVAADNSLVSWGSSPTYGELGYGENKAKSSTTPQEVKLLDGIFIRKVSCGFGHTLMIARDSTQGERDRIEKLPVWP